jgi:hypothetical protein
MLISNICNLLIAPLMSLHLLLYVPNTSAGAASMLSNILCSPTTFIRVFLYMKDGRRDLGDSSRHVSQNTGQCLIRFLRTRFVGCSASLDRIFRCGPEAFSASSFTSSLSLSLCSRPCPLPFYGESEARRRRWTVKKS